MKNSEVDMQQSDEVPADADEEMVSVSTGATGTGDEKQDASSPEAAAADAAPPPEDEIATLRDRVLRQTAEFQNFRRRVEQERQTDVKFGQSLVLQQLLDVYDDLRRSVEAAEDAVKDDSVDAETVLSNLLGGVELVFKKFTDELQRFGVEPIEAVGTPFNEDEHEAMMQQPAPEGTPGGTVLAEIQKGYRMGDRVLRHTKVVVAG